MSLNSPLVVVVINQRVCVCVCVCFCDGKIEFTFTRETRGAQQHVTLKKEKKEEDNHGKSEKNKRTRSLAKIKTSWYYGRHDDSYRSFPWSFRLPTLRILHPPLLFLLSPSALLSSSSSHCYFSPPLTFCIPFHFNLTRFFPFAMEIVFPRFRDLHGNSRISEIFHSENIKNISL